LIPVVTFDGEPYALLTPQLAGIARCELGPPAGSLANQERAILAAIDFLLRGF
jgi:toxin CcdB